MSEPSQHIKTIAAIVATDLNYAIGKDNKLLWHLPADLKFFKATTLGCPVIMGRKTYESIGRLLPGRKNIIVTRSQDYTVQGAEVFHSTEDAIASCNEEKIFVIGGAEVYRQTLPVCTEIFRTLVYASFEADTFFPNLEQAGYIRIWDEKHRADAKNAYDYTYEKWVKPA